jgi:hypothetical protein
MSPIFSQRVGFIFGAGPLLLGMVGLTCLSFDLPKEVEVSALIRTASLILAGVLFIAPLALPRLGMWYDAMLLAGLPTSLGIAGSLWLGSRITGLAGGAGLLLCFGSVIVGLSMPERSNLGTWGLRQVASLAGLMYAVAWLAVLVLHLSTTWIRLWAGLGVGLFFLLAVNWFAERVEDGIPRQALRVRSLYLIQLNLLLAAAVAATPR